MKKFSKYLLHLPKGLVTIKEERKETKEQTT